MIFTRTSPYHATSECGSYRICWWYPKPLTFFAYFGKPVSPEYLGMTMDRDAAIELCVQHEQSRANA